MVPFTLEMHFPVVPFSILSIQYLHLFLHSLIFLRLHFLHLQFYCKHFFTSRVFTIFTYHDHGECGFNQFFFLFYLGLCHQSSLLQPTVVLHSGCPNMLGSNLPFCTISNRTLFKMLTRHQNFVPEGRLELR